MASGLVFNLQKYSLQDGPGIRTTVFFKGCPLRCLWCHNPESICPRPEVLIMENRCIGCSECRDACPLPGAAGGAGCLDVRQDGCTCCGLCVEACPTGARQMVGREMTVEEVTREVLKDRMFYESSGGGVTISGGEPLNQPEFLIALLQSLRSHGIHTTLDTTGFGRTEDLLAAARLADLVLYDIKAIDDAQHRRLTGVSNRIILENLRRLDRDHRNIWLRLPVVPGFNDDRRNLQETADFITGLRNVTLVNFLPFHRTGLDKFERLGREHVLAEVQAPSPEWLAEAVNTFRDLGLAAKVGG